MMMMMMMKKKKKKMIHCLYKFKAPSSVFPVSLVCFDMIALVAVDGAYPPMFPTVCSSTSYNGWCQSHWPDGWPAMLHG